MNAQISVEAEIIRRRKELLEHVKSYASDIEMPLHLTGKKLTVPEELGRLQQIWRILVAHRDALGTFAQLYRCPDCEHFEGEHHATGCTRDLHVLITRPKNWSPQVAMTTPVEIQDFEYDMCTKAGCIYAQVPGTGFCVPHQPVGSTHKG